MVLNGAPGRICTRDSLVRSEPLLPRSRGGKTSWENCVLASKDVNSRKADRLPEEVGLRLLNERTNRAELNCGREGFDRPKCGI
jgi:hypothetical protein